MSLDAVLDLQSKVDIYCAIVKEDTKQDLCNIGILNGNGRSRVFLCRIRKK